MAAVLALVADSNQSASDFFSLLVETWELWTTASILQTVYHLGNICLA